MKLPVMIQKDITSLFQYALPLCAVMSRPNAIGWYHQKYLGIFGKESEDSTIWFWYPDSFDYLSNNKTNHIFDITRISTSEIKSSNFILPDYIRNNLKEDRYLVIFVDEFYISTSSKYQKTHLFHEYLVFGIDETGESIDCVGFDQRNTYQKLNISLTDFSLGFESVLLEEHEKMFGFTDRMVMSFHVPEFSAISTMETNQVIRKRILDYAHSVLPVHDNQFFTLCFENCDVQCGFHSINLLIRAFEYLLDRQDYSVDVRQILLVYEIRKSISVRGRQTIRSEKEKMLWDKYDDVMKEFKGIYMNFVKHAYVTDGEGYAVSHGSIRDREKNFEAMKKCLEHLKVSEEKVLVELVERIKI